MPFRYLRLSKLLFLGQPNCYPHHLTSALWQLFMAFHVPVKTERIFSGQFQSGFQWICHGLQSRSDENNIIGRGFKLRIYGQVSRGFHCIFFLSIKTCYA